MACVIIIVNGTLHTDSRHDLNIPGKYFVHFMSFPLDMETSAAQCTACAHIVNFCCVLCSKVFLFTTISVLI